MADAGLGDVSAVVASLPLGYTLGMIRHVNGVKYVLCYNDGGSDIPAGMIATVKAGSTTGYSVTVSTVSSAFNELAAVARNHAATVTTAYFWGAKEGYLASGLIASAACVPSGSAFYIGTNGNVVLYPQSVITGANPAGMAITTVLSTTSGGGRNGSVNLALK